MFHCGIRHSGASNKCGHDQAEDENWVTCTCYVSPDLHPIYAGQEEPDGRFGPSENIESFRSKWLNGFGSSSDTDRAQKQRKIRGLAVTVRNDDMIIGNG